MQIAFGQVAIDIYNMGMESLESYINKHRANKEKSSSFSEYLDSLIKKYGFKKDSEVYNKANISRQNWSLIMSDKVNPSIPTVIKIVFALHANNHECKYLLKKAGYTLASSSEYALIIRYCIDNKIYDLNVLNDYLIQYGYKDSLIY